MIIAFFCSLLFSLFVFQVTRWLDSNETEYYTHWGNIQSIRNSDEVSGRSMLGTGSIEQTEYYYYYYKSSEGYVRGKRPVNQTIIVDTEPTVRFANFNTVFDTDNPEKTTFEEHNDMEDEDTQITILDTEPPAPLDEFEDLEKKDEIEYEELA